MAVLAGLSQIDGHLAGLGADRVALFGQRCSLTGQEVGVGERAVEFDDEPPELSVLLFEVVDRVGVADGLVDVGECPFLSPRWWGGVGVLGELIEDALNGAVDCCWPVLQRGAAGDDLVE